MPIAIGTAASVSGSNWSGLADTQAIDGRAAIYEHPTSTDWLKLSNFNLAPSGTIAGIQVDAWGSGTCSGSSARLTDWGLSKDGGASVHGTLKQLTLDQTTDSGKTAGGAADLWGGAWSASDLASPNFCVMAKKAAIAAGQIRLDRVQVTVTYA